MYSEQLQSLTPQDWQLLTEGCPRAVYRRGQVILAEGLPSRTLYIVRKGLVRVERSRQGQGIAIDQLEPGEIFGEMSLLEDTVTSAAVIAQEDVEVDVVDDAHLQSLLSSEPGFAIRLYHSLAIRLSRRLRVMMQRVSTTGEAKHEPERQRIGNISARQIPQQLRDGVDAFEVALLRVDQGLRNGSLGDSAAQAQVAGICDTLLETLRHYSEGDMLVEIGWDDLLSFRDTPQLESGLGDYLFRATFGKFMLSATIAHCYSRPRGIVDDFEVSEMIFASEADGDDRLGMHIDRWFLSRPFCQGRRNSRRMMTDLIVRHGTSHTGPGPLLLTNLGSGVAWEVLDLFRDRKAPSLYATCLDIDHAALARTRDIADTLGCRESLNLVLGNVVTIAEGQDKLAIPPQELIYSVGMCDIVADDDVVSVLNWTHDHLDTGGTLVVTALHPAHPDRTFIEHILTWPLFYRTEEDLIALFSRSRFNERPVATQRDDTGTLIFASCVR